MKSKLLSTAMGLALPLCLFVTLLSAPQTAWGQAVTATITGTITDPSGATVVGATVTAKDIDRGTIWTAQTNEAGIYTLPRLPVGTYEVKVEAQGFQTAVYPPLTLVLNQTARVDFQMKVGAISETVEVTAAPPLLQTDTTQLNTVLEAHAITSLPLETRNYNQLALLIPGAITTSPAAFNSAQSTFNSGRPYINGNREQANYYLLDGMDNNEFADNNVAYSPNVDAIQEFNVITNNPSAEFGMFMGGVVSVSTKSGTNEYHGNVFEFFRNDVLNANEWSNNFQGLAKQKMRWNQFGGTFGGPIKKNKLFFFADYQGSRFDYPATSAHITTFTAAEAGYNLSDLGVALHYPGTTVAMPANLSQAAVCGSGQRMGVNPCITGISPTAKGILAALPTAAGAGLFNNANNTTRSYTNGNQGDIKIDWAPTDRDHIFGRYTQQHVVIANTNSQSVLYNGSGNNILPIQNVVLDYTRTMSPSWVNDFRIGVNYDPAEGNIQDQPSTNLSKLVPGALTPFLPGLAFVGAPPGGGLNGPFAFGTVDSAEIFHQTVIQVEDTVVHTHGPHTLHMGFQFLRYRNNFNPSTSPDGKAGQIIFSGQYTGNAEADFLLGLPSYMGYGAAGFGTVGQRNNAYGLFVQDDWRVNNRLTVNLGLRWQVFTPVYEVHDRQVNFGEITGAIQLAGQNGNSRALYDQYNGIANFLPRVGLAWTPWGNNTVIRAAFSRSSFQEGTGEYNRLPVNSPFVSDLVGQWTSGPNGSIPPTQVTLDQGFAGLSTAASGGAPCTISNVTTNLVSCFAGQRLHLTDPNYRPAVSNQWSLAIQRQFGNSTTVQVAYVGQHSDHLAAIWNAGQMVLLPNGTVTPGPYLSGNPGLKYVGGTYPNNGTGQVRLNTTTGIQNYNALQITLQQRLTHGLAAQANYTWSKCLTNNFGYYARYWDNALSQASADISFQMNVYNIGLDYGLCDHDVRNVFNGYLTYDLPFGHGRAFANNVNPFLNAVIGGWQGAAIFTVHGGFPISMLDFAGDPGTGSFQPRPECNGPAIQTPYTQNPAGGYIWFSTANMSHPPAGHFGNCPVSSNWGPGYKQIDLSLNKHFKITEHQNIEFRFEMINAFNTPVFVVNGYSVDIFGGANAGVVNTSQGARNIQFALKYSF